MTTITIKDAAILSPPIETAQQQPTSPADEAFGSGRKAARPQPKEPEASVGDSRKKRKTRLKS